MKFYEGCTALITGASSGLGEEFARQLAPYSGTLVLVARRLDRLEHLKTDLETLHPDLTVHVYGADLRNEGERTRLASWLGEQKIEVDFLINNAGLGDHGAFVDGSWERVRAMLDVNIAALTHLTHLLLPGMVESGRAAVLNVSSVAGFLPIPNHAVYAATKAYVTSFSEALAIELRPRGVTVTALCPGPVPTEFFDVAAREGSDAESHLTSMPAFVVSAPEVVRAGLVAVMRDRARVIPSPLLAISIFFALLVPFVVVREVIRSFSKRL